MFEASILSFVDKNNDREVVKKENKIVDNASLIKITEKNIVKNEEKNMDVPVKEEKNYKINESVISKDKSLIFAVVNNTFATAKKEYLLNLKENWFKLNDFVLDKSYGAAACFLIDSVLRVVGENEFIIENEYIIDEIKYSCYEVKLNWEYEKDLGYEKEGTIYLIKDKYELFVVEKK